MPIKAYSVHHRLRRNLMKKPATPTEELHRRQASPLITPTDLEPAAVKDIVAAMNGILADVFAIYLKTKNFHWHMSGPHFRDYHLLLDEQGDQIFAMTDDCRARPQARRRDYKIDWRHRP